MTRLSPVRVGLAAIAVCMGLAAVLYGRTQKPFAPPPRYYMECLSLRSVGNDINTQASQGWSVTAMVDHVGQDGQECILVLFERAAQGK